MYLKSKLEFWRISVFPSKNSKRDKRRRKLIEGGVIISTKIAIDTEVQKTSSKIRCVNQPHLQNRSQSKWKLETQGFNITLFGHPKTLSKTLKDRFLEIRYCLERCFFLWSIYCPDKLKFSEAVFTFHFFEIKTNSEFLKWQYPKSRDLSFRKRIDDFCGDFNEIEPTLIL